ncbi:MAG: restriction endonuclease [Clostridiales bacterium]|nr:restriction endonuclease [Clostridiales bacterium]
MIIGIVITSVGAYFATSVSDTIGILFIISGILSILIGCGLLFSAYSKKKQYEKQQELLSKSNINQVDQMDGITFERFLQAIFTKLGYEVQLTRTTGDYGADLILKKDNEIIAVQAKNSKNKISISAVQEIIGAKSYYHATKIAVATNNFFTQPAINLANANGVDLIDRTRLAEIICQSRNINSNQNRNSSEHNPAA